MNADKRQRIDRTESLKKRVYHNLFPKAHPYYGSVIGSHQDIQAATARRCPAIFQTVLHAEQRQSRDRWRHRQGEDAKARRKVFRNTEARAETFRPFASRHLRITSERRVVVKDHVELPRVYMVWLAPAIYKPGDAEAHDYGRPFWVQEDRAASTRNSSTRSKLRKT